MYSRLLPFLLVIFVLHHATAQPDDSVFGSSDYGDGALIGIFYDLKQTQDRRPIPDAHENYIRLLDQFASDGLDESYLNNYFRAGLPLYATQIFIPNMSADEAPKAFKVDGVVDPKHWIIHYKGQVSPPESGNYRFVGAADDVLIVAIDRKVVLVANRPDSTLHGLGWSAPQDDIRAAVHHDSVYGTWIELKAGKPVDIDIIVGERPGGRFDAALAYQRQGESYPRAGNGRLLLPLFQLAPGTASPNAVLTDRPPWTIYP